MYSNPPLLIQFLTSDRNVEAASTSGQNYLGILLQSCQGCVSLSKEFSVFFFKKKKKVLAKLGLSEALAGSVTWVLFNKFNLDNFQYS